MGAEKVFMGTGTSVLRLFFPCPNIPAPPFSISAAVNPRFSTMIHSPRPALPIPHFWPQEFATAGSKFLTLPEPRHILDRISISNFLSCALATYRRPPRIFFSNLGPSVKPRILVVFLF